MRRGQRGGEGGRAMTTTAVVATTLVSDWLVEIEVVAAGER
ncbi:hypothetical protein [Lentzea sp. NBRC 102530]|nr:hypothetical protein [Lentzea sp. NBRC 102530]